MNIGSAKALQRLLGCVDFPSLVEDIVALEGFEDACLFTVRVDGLILEANDVLAYDEQIDLNVTELLRAKQFNQR